MARKTAVGPDTTARADEQAELRALASKVISLEIELAAVRAQLAAVLGSGRLPTEGTDGLWFLEEAGGPK